MFWGVPSEEELIELASEMPDDELNAMLDALKKARARKRLKQVAITPAQTPPLVPRKNVLMVPLTSPKTGCDCGAVKVGGKHYDWCTSLSA